jgi:UDP-N-acetylglucosamine acyltransferase
MGVSMPEVSRHAVVDGSAELAEDVRVGPFAYVGPGVRLGPGCIIDPSATVIGRSTLGAKCHVFPHAIVGLAETEDQEAQCLIGQANHIREHVTIYGGVERPTILGDDNLIMIGCRIGAGARVGSHCILSNCTQIDRLATIEDYVGTSAFTFVGPGAAVGTYSYVVGFTGVDGAAPPFAMVQGFPFRVRGVNSEKLRRCGFGDDDIRALKDAFRQLFNHTGARVDSAALKRLAGEQGLNAHVRRLVEALRAHGGGRPRE